MRMGRQDLGRAGRENPDDDRPPFEERYGLSEDGQRLIEVVHSRGALGGFTVSRVWDRVAADK